MQRKLERAIRKQKRRVLVDESMGDKEKLLTDKTKLQMYKQQYNRFSKAAGLRTEAERLHVAGIGHEQIKQKTTNLLATAYFAESDKIEWPPRGESISMNAFREIRPSAESRGIKLQVQGIFNLQPLETEYMEAITLFSKIPKNFQSDSGFSESGAVYI